MSALWLRRLSLRIVFFYALFAAYNCCPSGYTHCADKGYWCYGSGIVAYGNDWNGYAYKMIDDTLGYIWCHNRPFSYPADGATKDCCG